MQYIIGVYATDQTFRNYKKISIIFEQNKIL